MRRCRGPVTWVIPAALVPAWLKCSEDGLLNGIPTRQERPVGLFPGPDLAPKQVRPALPASRARRPGQRRVRARAWWLGGGS